MFLLGIIVDICEFYWFCLSGQMRIGLLKLLLIMCLKIRELNLVMDDWGMKRFSYGCGMFYSFCEVRLIFMLCSLLRNFLQGMLVVKISVGMKCSGDNMCFMVLLRVVMLWGLNFFMSLMQQSIELFLEGIIFGLIFFLLKGIEFYLLLVFLFFNIMNFLMQLKVDDGGCEISSF